MYLRQRPKSVNWESLPPRSSATVRLGNSLALGLQRGVNSISLQCIPWPVACSEWGACLTDFDRSSTLDFPVQASGLWSRSGSKVDQFVHVPTPVDMQNPAYCRRRCRPQNIWNMCVPSVHLWNESSNDDDLNVSASAKRLTPMKDSPKTVAKSRHLFISGITCNHPPRQKPFGINPYDKKIPLCN